MKGLTSTWWPSTIPRPPCTPQGPSICCHWAILSPKRSPIFFQKHTAFPNGWIFFQTNFFQKPIFSWHSWSLFNGAQFLEKEKTTSALLLRRSCWLRRPRWMPETRMAILLCLMLPNLARKRWRISSSGC